MIHSDSLTTLGLVLILTGFAAIFLALFLMHFSSETREDNIKGGGAIIIGPFPIIFGTSKKIVKYLLALSIVLIILVFLTQILFYTMK